MATPVKRPSFGHCKLIERILQSLITEVKAFCRFQLNDDLTLIVIAAD
jgi:hypothetical protein